MRQDLHHGREAFQRSAWREAATLLAAADDTAPLAVDDLERLAVAAYLMGDDETSLEAWTRVHQNCLEEQQVPRAIRAAFWMMLELMDRAEWARAGGWLARCRRLLGPDRDCAESGLLLVLEARTALKRADSAAAYEASFQAVELAERFPDPELRAFGLLAKGLVLARQGNTAEAVLLFDEAMVATTIGCVSPITVGTVYCAVIDVCHHIMDLGRMREWTEVLSVWCSRQPDLVPFRGECLVHRAEILGMGGAWSRALEEARQACGPPSEATPAEHSAAIEPRSVARGRPMGAAFYLIAEIHRVRGEFAEADAAYREASAYGRPPGAGLALLRLAQGDKAGAAAAIRRALVEPASLRVRAATLAAVVEIELAACDLAAARHAVDQLAALTAEARLPWFTALLAQSTGSLLLAEGDAARAIERLREAWMTWQELEAPFDAARVRVTMGMAQRAMGDDEAAGLEFDAARRVCQRLGAEPELRRIERLRGTSKRAGIAGLTAREQEILARVATGMTNRAIAQELFISDRTVDRHVSNILTKLDLASRSAATAYAYEHGLV